MTQHQTSRTLSLQAARILALAVGLAAASSTFAQVTGVSDTAAQTQPSRLTRAEVQADFNLWRRAGADRYSEDALLGMDQPGYDRAYAEYRRLRNGPAYAEELARVKSRLGDDHGDSRLAQGR